MQRGFAPILVLVGIVVLVMVAGGAYYLTGIFYPSVGSVAIKSSRENDLVKKSTVNYVHSLIKQYHQQHGVYPKSLNELTKDEGDLKMFTSSPPFYFESDGTTYQYYAKLNNGEIFNGDPEEINKELDAVVRGDVSTITIMVNFYYSETKRLPKNLEEIATLSSLSYFKLQNNPITGKSYTYIPKGDGTNFKVSGTLSNGSEYEIPIN